MSGRTSKSQRPRKCPRNPLRGLSGGLHCPVISISAQAVQSVKCRRLVTFGERGVVEYRIDEIGDLSLEEQDGLADVQKFRGVFPKDVYAKQFQSFAMEEKFQPSVRVAGDLAARNFPVIRNSHFVWHVAFRELLFGLSDKGNLRNRVNAVGIPLWIGFHLQAK